MATGTLFPTAKDSFSNKVDGIDDILSDETNTQSSAIEALQTKVGITNSADVTSHEYKINNVILSDPTTTRGDILVRDASALVRLALGADTKSLVSDGTDVAWGDPGGLTTRGDIIVRDASGATRLPVGNSGQILGNDGTDPSWTTNLGIIVETATGAAIQAAIDSLASGGLVILLAQTYVITTQITVTYPNITIQGGGRGTLLSGVTGADINVIYSDKAGTVIKDLSIIGCTTSKGDASGADYGINFGSSATNCLIKDCYIYNADVDGIKIAGVDNYIKDNKIDTCGTHGIDLIGTVSRNVVSGNNINDCGGGAIYLNGADFNVISANKCTGCDTNGIWALNTARSNTITGNNVQSCGTYGIFLDTPDDDNNVVTGNMCEGHSSFGLKIEGGDYNIIDGNMFHDNVGGLSVTGTGNVTGDNVL